MALPALRHKFMLCMVAKCAINLCMFARSLPPFAVDIRVARSAGRRRSIIRIGYLQRSVNGVTCGAGISFLSFEMRFMAIEARRFQSVGRMAGIACHLGVLALEAVQLLLRARMALAACVCQSGAHRHLPGGMGIVAARAVGHLSAVRLLMAGIAVGHDGIVVPLFRIIGMECGVAFLTVETVLSATVL